MISIELYVDGSYQKDNPSAVYGGYVAVFNGKPLIAHRCTVEGVPFTSMHNVGGELYAAMEGVAMVGECLKAEGITEEVQLTLYYDYAGIEAFIQGRPVWKAKQPGAVAYVHGMSRIQETYPSIHLKFQKVKAHSGVLWNEAADQIAAGRCPASCQAVLL